MTKNSRHVNLLRTVASSYTIPSDHTPVMKAYELTGSMQNNKRPKIADI